MNFRHLTVCVVLLAALLATVADAARIRCGRDMSQPGPFCLDIYEASVWLIPSTETGLIRRVQKGRATEAALIAGGASQKGTAGDDSVSL